MPNWVRNRIEFSGKQEDINKVLSFIKGNNDDFDFNKLIPMPESLNLTSGGYQNEAIVYALQKKPQDEREEIIQKLKQTHAGFYGNYYLKATKYIDTERIVRAKENFEKELNGDDKTLFRDVDYEKLEIKSFEDLGNVYLNNILEYGYDTWYDWRCDNWGTKWNACDVYVGRDIIEFNTAWSCPLPVLNKLAELCYQHNIEFTGKWADEDMGCNTGIFESDCCGDEYYFGYEYMENCSNEAYEIYVELNGENDCIGQDEDGNWVHYNCDDCPNLCC